MIRLINTASLELVEFQANTPPYAILSHTHGDDELTYQQWVAAFPSNAPGWLDLVASKAGFHKVAAFCRLCQDQGHEWAWADVCCVDRNNMVELFESINSMYRWYARAIVCYAYLVDVPTDDNVESITSAFSKSRYFTRGWTLLELIAPGHVEFLSCDWRFLASKRSASDILARITGIPFPSFSPLELSKYSVAQKMSWAAPRETSRREDVAYCLMGLFKVNMPILYGEGGRNAFRRLQLEIMKQTTDHTIFAWTEAPYSETYTKTQDTTTWSMLAPSPVHFRRSGSYRQLTPQVMKSDTVSYIPHSIIHRPFRMTNHGLRIPLYLIPRPLLPSMHSSDCHQRCMLALLNCYADDGTTSASIGGKDGGGFTAPARPQLALHLQPHASGQPNVYERGRCRTLELVTRQGLRRALTKMRFATQRLSKADAMSPGLALTVYVAWPEGA